MRPLYKLSCGLLVFYVSFLHGQWESVQQFCERGTAQPTNAWNISSSFGGMVHVVWSDTRDVNSVVYYRRSTDYGKTWADEIRFVDGKIPLPTKPGLGIELNTEAIEKYRVN